MKNNKCEFSIYSIPHNKGLLIFLLFAISLTISCTSEVSGGSGGGSGDGGGYENPSSSSAGDNSASDEITGISVITNKTSNSITYKGLYEEYECIEGGILKMEKKLYDEEYTLNYSIANNVLVLQYPWHLYSEDNGKAYDTLHFSGNSNNLIQTWTRTKNKTASCDLSSGATFYKCKADWQATKKVITADTIKTTHDYCSTDEQLDEASIRETGWKIRITGCNTLEYYKGTEIVTIKHAWSDIYDWSAIASATYNGKTCNINLSLSQLEKACTDAWNEYLSEGSGSFKSEVYYDYFNYSYSEYYECMRNILPSEYWELFVF